MASLPDLASLSSEALQSRTVRLEALKKIRWALDGDNPDQIIRLLASKPGLLEYILSGKLTSICIIKVHLY